MLQEELDGERELPEVLTQVSEVRLDAVSAPRFDCAARKTRRAFVAFLRL